MSRKRAPWVLCGEDGDFYVVGTDDVSVARDVIRDDDPEWWEESRERALSADLARVIRLKAVPNPWEGGVWYHPAGPNTRGAVKAVWWGYHEIYYGVHFEAFRDMTPEERIAAHEARRSI